MAVIYLHLSKVFDALPAQGNSFLPWQGMDKKAVMRICMSLHTGKRQTRERLGERSLKDSPFSCCL